MRFFLDEIHVQRACLSRNYEDFEELHLLVAVAQGRHFGILIARRENDSTRNLTSKGIVAAICKLQAAGVPVDGQYIVLNHWRRRAVRHDGRRGKAGQRNLPKAIYADPFSARSV